VIADRTLAPLGRRRAEVVAREAAGAYAVLVVADPDGPPPDPGQFYMLAAVEGWGGGADERPFLPRACSVLRAGGVGTLRFLLEDVGPGTHRLVALGPGDGLWLLGPLGRGFRAPEGGFGAAAHGVGASGGGREPLLVGGGVGIAPLATWQDAVGGAALLGFRDAAHAEAAALFADATVATDDGSVGHHGVVTDLLGERLGDAVAVYACGPPAMLEAVRSMTVAAGVPAQLALESGMACGFGACYGCVVPTTSGYVRLCVDGPVLDAEVLAP
jgi:dihydroorotate dehydrogenase electron transfer subunit